MIIELLLTATCTLGPGVDYTAPQGWVISKVQTQGQINACSGVTCLAINYPIYADNRVTVTRTITPGETVTAPAGCDVTTTAQSHRGKHFLGLDPGLSPIAHSECLKEAAKETSFLDAMTAYKACAEKEPTP